VWRATHVSVLLILCLVLRGSNPDRWRFFKRYFTLLLLCRSGSVTPHTHR
jgi:hypothetical protein